MTLKPLTLDEYFKLIVKPETPKEPNMFERSKAYFQSVKDAWSSLYTWDVELKKGKVVDQDMWSFAIHSTEFEGQDEFVPERTSHIGGLTHDATWVEIVDEILDTLGDHFGYDIKSQVYYAVEFPTNDLEGEGKGRKLNDGVLQQLLLAFPEVYERNEEFGKVKDIFAQ